MKKGLVFGFVFLVLVLSFVSAGLFDWFRISDSIEITGNALKEGEYISGDCVECIDYMYGIWCADDNQCYQDPQLYCTNQIYSSQDCGGDNYCPGSCSEVTSCSSYECGGCSDVPDGCYSLICGSCGTNEICEYNQCVFSCGTGETLKSRVADPSATLSTSLSDSACCSSTSCVVSGTCYSSGSTYYYTGDFCYQGSWYGSQLDATCGDDLCLGEENYENCPQDCEGECISGSDCLENVCQIKSCSNYQCVYSNVEDATPCQGGFCIGGNCIPPACSSDSDCNDSDINTEDVCLSPGMYEAECSNIPITACISGDGVCPTGCLIETDSDCSKGCGDGIMNYEETCSSCPGDVKCASNQKCSNGECVLNIIDYDFSSTSENIVFEDDAEKTEIQKVVKSIKAESGITFRVDVLEDLPSDYEIPEGEKLFKVLNISSSKPKINAYLEFNLDEEILDFSIDFVKIYVEGESKSWEILDFEGSPGFEDGVYNLGVYTQHFSIFLITEPEICGNGKFDSSEEECDESVSGVENCMNCLCKAGFNPDGEGSCFEDFGGQGCAEVGEWQCSGYSYYNCSEENLWVGQGNLVGKCGVECIYGDTGCEGEIPKECGSDYEWHLKERVSGLCGYEAVRTTRVEENTYEEEVPCEDGNCVSNDGGYAKEEGDSNSSLIGIIIAGLIILIVVIAFTLIKVHNRLENK